MKSWLITHKGHSIEITNSLFGEKLIVDGEVQDKHSGITLRGGLDGRIKSGDGSGEIIKVSLRGFWTVGCVVLIDNKEVFRS